MFLLISTMTLISVRFVLIFIFLLRYMRTEGKGIRYFCGPRYQSYDPANEECIDWQVFKKSATSTSSYTPTSPNSPAVPTVAVNISEKKQDRALRQTCRSQDDILTCNRNVYCGRNEGFRCCGFGIYHPGTQTCCRVTSAEYKIHDDKPEKTHICCSVDVYERGSPKATCQHAAANDKFFKRPNKLRNDQSICQESVYVFRIKITQQKEHHLTADVRVWTWRPAPRHGKLRMKKSPKLRKEMDINLDKHSTRKNIAKKRFLIFSQYNYMKDTVLFVRSNDVLYRSPRRHTVMVRKLRKIRAKCSSK